MQFVISNELHHSFKRSIVSPAYSFCLFTMAQHVDQSLLWGSCRGFPPRYVLLLLLLCVGFLISSQRKDLSALGLAYLPRR